MIPVLALDLNCRLVTVHKVLAFPGKFLSVVVLELIIFNI